MEQKKIWIATYDEGLLPETKVMAFNEKEAYKAALATYRYRNEMNNSPRWEGAIVKSVRLAEDQSVFGGTSIQPTSAFAHEKPAVNLHFQGTPYED